jgi:hypothetical protein
LILPSKKFIIVFIVSYLAESADPGKDVIIHLVRKATATMVSQFCLVGGEGYGEVQSKVEKMILKEFGRK